MAKWISRDQDLRNHEEKESFNLRAQKLFGILNDVYREIDRSKPATVFPTHETIKALKDHQIEFEQKKSEAFAQWCRLKAFNR